MNLFQLETPYGVFAVNISKVNAIYRRDDTITILFSAEKTKDVTYQYNDSTAARKAHLTFLESIKEYNESRPC